MEKLHYSHPLVKQAESAWFDLYEKSDYLQSLSDRELSIAGEMFTEGYLVALLANKGE